MLRLPQRTTLKLCTRAKSIAAATLNHTARYCSLYAVSPARAHTKNFSATTKGTPCKHKRLLSTAAALDSTGELAKPDASVEAEVDSGKTGEQDEDGTLPAASTSVKRKHVKSQEKTLSVKPTQLIRKLAAPIKRRLIYENVHETEVFSKSLRDWVRQDPENGHFEDVMQSLIERKFPNSLETVAAVMAEYAVCGIHGEVDAAFAYLQKNDMKPNAACFTTAILSKVDSAQYESAANMFEVVMLHIEEKVAKSEEGMAEAESEEGIADAESEERMADAQGDGTETLRSLVHHMLSPSLLEAGIVAYLRNEQPDAALAILRFGRRFRISPTATSVSYLFRDAQRRSDVRFLREAIHKVSKMREVSVDCFVDALTASSAIGDFHGCWKMWRSVFKLFPLASAASSSLSGLDAYGFEKEVGDHKPLIREAIALSNEALKSAYGDDVFSELRPPQPLTPRRNKPQNTDPPSGAITAILSACGQLEPTDIAIDPEAMRFDTVNTFDSTTEATAALGAVLAKLIWTNLSVANVPLTAANRSAYVQALAWQGEWKEAERILFQARTLTKKEFLTFLEQTADSTQNPGWNLPDSTTYGKHREKFKRLALEKKFASANLTRTTPTAFNPPRILLGGAPKKKIESLSSTATIPTAGPHAITAVATLLNAVAYLGLDHEFDRIAERAVKELDGFTDPKNSDSRLIKSIDYMRRTRARSKDNHTTTAELKVTSETEAL